MAGKDQGCNDQAVLGYSIAGAGIADQDDHAAAEGPHGIGYCQAGGGEIVAAAQRTVAHADSVALDCQMNTQVPDADSRSGKASVPRSVEETYATSRKSCYGTLVAAAAAV